jgi:CheY-like chemotaxis protein
MLDALERDLPETFPELARDRTFTGLVQALDDTTVREQLSAKLRRRGLEAAKAATQEFGLPRHDEAGSAAELSGLRLLWLDSHGSQRGFLRKQLDQAGASVTCATQLHEVIDAVAAGRFDVVVTNLKRPTARDGGFDDIAEMRRAGYDGPFVVYTGYVSPARRERAARERVSITAEPDEARQLIIQAWTGGQSSGLDLAGITALWLAPYSNLPFLRHLGARGADVVEADSPAGAIAAIRSQAVDAVVADPFPGWKGFAYISELRKEAESAELLPALVLAHRATPQRRREAAALGIEITDDAAMATRWLARIAAAKAAPDAA